MSKKGQRFRIFLVEDHPVVRQCLKGFLDHKAEFDICGEAERATSAFSEILQTQPDLVILDLSLHASSGFELIRAMKSKCPKIKILVFSMHDEKLYAERCIRAGANGYVMKRESTERLLIAIRDILGGKVSVSESIMAIFAQEFAAGRGLEQSVPKNKLSDRELEILNLLGDATSSRKISQSLNISIKTVHAHCFNIKHKLGLSSARELLREATKWREINSAFE